MAAVCYSSFCGLPWGWPLSRRPLPASGRAGGVAPWKGVVRTLADWSTGLPAAMWSGKPRSPAKATLRRLSRRTPLMSRSRAGRRRTRGCWWPFRSSSGLRCCSSSRRRSRVSLASARWQKVAAARQWQGWPDCACW